MSLNDKIAYIARKRRVYASIQEGETKQQKEINVVHDLLKSMERSGQPEFFNPQISTLDPPDCIVRTADDQLVAIEVTELVDQTAVEINQRSDPQAIARFEPGAMVLRVWSQPDFLARIAELLRKKDTKIFHGGPFGRVAVVIHTDEPALQHSECESWLSGHCFGPFRQLTEAYILYNYEPDFGYPFQRLLLGGA